MTDYKELLDSTPIGIWRTNQQTGELIHLNKSAKRILSLLDVQDIQEKSNYLSCLDKEFLKKLSHQKEVNNYRCLIKDKNNRETPVLISAKINQEEGCIDGTIQECPYYINLENIIKPYAKKMTAIKQFLSEKLSESVVCENNTI
jgi:hypothetical protein